jgi:hypothetical protein
MVALLYSTVIVILAGSLIRFKENDLYLRLALYYLAGTVILSLYMLALSIIGIPYSILSISLPFILYLIFSLGQWKEIKLPSFSFDLKFALLLLIISMVFLAMLSTTFTLPVFRADALGGWVFRAKVFFIEKRVALDVFRDKVFCNTADYPSLVPLNLAWISTCLGRWDDTSVKIFFALQYLAAMTIFYYSLKQSKVNNVISLASTLIVFTIPNLLTNLDIAYVDSSLSFYVLASAIFLYRWSMSGDKGELLTSSFFIGASAWIKNDGIGLVIAMLLTVFIMKAKVRDIAAYALTACAVFIPYKLMAAYYAIGTHMMPDQNIIMNIVRLPTILYWYFHEFFLNAYYWQYFWLLLFILFIVFRKKLLSSNLKYLIFFFLLSLAIYLSVYLIAPEKVYLFLYNTADRLLLGLAPAIAFAIFAGSFAQERSQ